jgi:hypothetical protein
MTLDELLLERLAEWRPVTGDRETLNLPDATSGWSVALTADRCDDLGARVWELRVRRIREAPAGETLAAWAHRVAGRVKGLLETLTVLEIDAQRNEALLRSTEPSHKKETLAYYEVLLRGTREAEVRRYQNAPAGAKREQVPFALTHEVLARFVADLAA